MAKRKRSRANRSRHRRKKGKYSRKNVLVCRGPSVVPDRYLCKLRFSDTINITVGATVVLRANSLFDPDGSTNQPLGFDQMIALYDRYKVGACSIKVTLMNHAATQLQVCLFPQAESVVPNNWDEAVTQPYAKSIYLGAAGSGQAVKTIKHFMTTKAIRGQRLVSTESLGAAVTASPAFLWYWRYNYEPLPIITGAVDFTAVYEMTMYTAFYRRAYIPSSDG